MESRAFGKAHRSVLPQPGLSGLRRTGLFSFPALSMSEGEEVSAYFTRTEVQEAFAENTRQTSALLQTLCWSVRSALSFFQKVFHSFSRREIGFSVVRGDPDVALTGDSGGDP